NLFAAGRCPPNANEIRDDDGARTAFANVRAHGPLRRPDLPERWGADPLSGDVQARRASRRPDLPERRGMAAGRPLRRVLVVTKGRLALPGARRRTRGSDRRRYGLRTVTAPSSPDPGQHWPGLDSLPTAPPPVGGPPPTPYPGAGGFPPGGPPPATPP